MAGGQGTRLEHQGPKGTFKLDVYGKGKYLFEILADNLQEANKKYGVVINWYIMTSKENNADTVEFLEKNNYFGYDKNKVTIFKQSELPLVDTEGKFLINKEYKIKEASDGNGGTYSSLRASGCLADMKEKGIKWVFIGSVDNALLKMIDVTLLGMAVKKGVQIASKSVAKANPQERVGVFCKMNNHPKVIEYTELPEKMAEEVDSDGELKFGESHIMCNLYTIDAIEKISKEPLIYHTAFKKNSYIDENGKEVIPTEPNSYKFESFIFDAFEFFDDIAILRGKREDDFAPVKNREGVDSPKTAKELYEKYWQNRK
jgi:UDP-N-acetylglucosamine pyrophosphorylase